MKVLVFGPSGMVGQEIVRSLSKEEGLSVTTIGRTKGDLYFAAGRDRLEDLPIGEFDIAINCIGLTPQRADLSHDRNAIQAALVNSLFPHALSAFAKARGGRMLQIATDCAYSGTEGPYSENRVVDAVDVYGKSKRIGEVVDSDVMNLRTSVVGVGSTAQNSLLEWVVRQPIGSEIDGYVDRHWSGVTSLAFAKVVAGVILTDSFAAGTFHLVPQDYTTKFELVSSIARHFMRSDLVISPVESGESKNLVLETMFPDNNYAFWRAAGYPVPPTIDFLIAELYSDLASRFLQKDL